MIHFQRLLERSDSSLESTSQDREVAVELNIVEVLRSDVETADNAIELCSIEINPDKTNVRYYQIIVIIVSAIYIEDISFQCFRIHNIFLYLPLDKN